MPGPGIEPELFPWEAVILTIRPLRLNMMIMMVMIRRRRSKKRRCLRRRRSWRRRVNGGEGRDAWSRIDNKIDNFMF